MQTGDAWADYKRRRLRFWVVWLTYIPGAGTLGFVMHWLTGSELPFYFVAGAWMLAFAAAGISLSNFPCPRCRKPFFSAWLYHNPFARRCMHCGLPKWEEPDSEARI